MPSRMSCVRKLPICCSNPSSNATACSRVPGRSWSLNAREYSLGPGKRTRRLKDSCGRWISMPSRMSCVKKLPICSPLFSNHGSVCRAAAQGITTSIGKFPLEERTLCLELKLLLTLRTELLFITWDARVLTARSRFRTCPTAGCLAESEIRPT